MKQMYGNANVMWSEEEIIYREYLIRRIPVSIFNVWSALNPAVRMVRVETPILTPSDFLKSHIDVGFDLLGPVGKNNERGYLRPETTAGSFEAMKVLFPQKENLIKNLPFCVWQVGKSFRDEEHGNTMKASKLRLVEFHQLEFQLFLRPGTKADFLGAALSKLHHMFGGAIVWANDLPHYSSKTLDWHILGLEVAGCSMRTDFEHGDVVEIAIGLDRLIALTMA
jgi:hypothetical protein